MRDMTSNVSNLARVNGIELGYQIFGEGEPLVLLHGGFGSVEMFGANVELLAVGRQVIGVDLQSHGRSPATDRPMRFETMADDIEALIRSLGLERAAIMGFSLGGGQRDAGWDRSGMTHHRLAILPGVTHYDINVVPTLSAAVIPFLDGR
jgi:alpha-beta hydrolase superfamily lysophospholipase